MSKHPGYFVLGIFIGLFVLGGVMGIIVYTVIHFLAKWW